jgi:alkylresorcinol/alkylpyrone synthase
VPVSLLSVASASPPNVLTQGDVVTFARHMFSDRFREFARLEPVFDNAGITARQSVQPISWFYENRSWTERTAAYLAGACDLYVQAATTALERAGVKADEVDAIVTVSSTGIATPSIEARVLHRMGFRADVERVPVFGLGCAGGVSGLAIAARLADSKPGRTVLFVTIELCTLAFRLDELTSANIVATALFGDGAAAAVVRSGEAGAMVIEGAGEHTWPDTLNIMGWDIDPQGFSVIFDRAIPPFAEANLGPAIDGILARMGLAHGDIDRFVCHPGGAKVISALEAALRTGPGTLDVERQVLDAHGNMSAPTVLFVLEQLLKSKPSGRLALTAVGPGFTASCVSLMVRP